MTKTEYREYLCSTHWKNLRKEMIEGADSKCERCKITRWLAEIVYDQDLHVHHKTYANIGNESWEDLEVLCRRCHDMESNGRTDLPRLKPQICGLCRETHWDKRADFCASCEMILEGPGLYHLVRTRHPHSGIPMWEHVMKEVALACFLNDEFEVLISSLIEFRDLNTELRKQALAEGLPF